MYAWINMCLFAEEYVNLIVKSGVVPVLVRHLQAPPPQTDYSPKPYEHEVEKGSAFTLGLLAIKVIDIPIFNFFFSKSLAVFAWLFIESVILFIYEKCLVNVIWM